MIGRFRSDMSITCHDWRKFWTRFHRCFVFQSRVSTKTVVIKGVIRRARNFKSASRFALVRFLNYSRNYSMNCTPLGPITITNHTYIKQIGLPALPCRSILLSLMISNRIGLHSVINPIITQVSYGDVLAMRSKDLWKFFHEAVVLLGRGKCWMHFGQSLLYFYDVY